MALLSEPAEILDLADGQEATFKVVSWEEGEMRIQPVYEPGLPSQLITVLRIHVPPESKDSVPYYWDITSKRLRAGLLPYLKRPDFRDKIFTVLARGFRPTKRFSLTVS